MKRILTVIIILASLFITTCDNIALGSALNLNGPVVEITGPATEPGKTDPEVGTLFEFCGTATSESTITRMSVTLSYFNRAIGIGTMVTMGREWRYEGGSWQIRESDKDTWKTYTSNIYEALLEDYPVEAPSWTVLDKMVDWRLPIYMDRMEKGQYYIKVQAWDNAGNSDSNSSKRLKVEFNNKAPTIKIVLPTLKEGEGSLGVPLPPDFSGSMYKFDPFGAPRQTYDNRGNFTNKFPDFRWEAEQSASLKTLIIEITNEHNLDIADPRKKTYYKEEFDLADTKYNGAFNGTSGSKGNHIQGGIVGVYNGTSYIKVGNEIKLGLGEYIDNFNLLPKDRITPLQVVTTIVDSTGLKEYKSKGWIMYLPYSDKPFADISFGFKVKDTQNAPVDAPDNMVIMRGTTSNKVYFYDDKEGLKSITWTLNKLKDNSLEFEESFTERKGTINPTNNPTTYTWEFAADYSYGIGRYRLDVQATDTSGTEGDIYTAYFTIISNTAPQIIDWPTSLAPSGQTMLATTLWGNSTGNINFSGTAAIEDKDDCDGTNHAVKIDRVTVVLLNFEDGDEMGGQNYMRFIDSSYSGWNSGKNYGDANGLYTDGYGNKIWEIPSTSITFDLSTAGNKSPDFREYWNFSKTLNWFTDLNGNRSTKNKRLMVRAVTYGMQGREYYGTKELTIHGDDHAPSVEITRLRLERRSNDTSTDWTLVKEYTLQGLQEMLPNISRNHRIKLFGTWDDDSSTAWTSIAGKTLPRDLFKPIVVRWEGTQNKYNLTFNYGAFSNSTKTWETEWFTGFPEQGNTDPSINLIATFEDLAGNVKGDEKSIIVETDTPTLSRISSETANGKYTTGNKINIFLGFNKAIYLDTTGGGVSTTGLALQLSNGGTAIYKEGLGEITVAGGVVSKVKEGSEKIVFEYTVGSGDQEMRINVTGIIAGSTGIIPPSNNPQPRLKSIENSNALIPTFVFDSSNASSFAGQKNIIIDKTPPKVMNTTTSAASNRTYGVKQQIFFTVEFDEDIDIDDSTISSSTTYLSLTGGNLSERGAKAGYNGKAGARSVQFVYNVSEKEGDDSKGASISINSVNGFDKIMDKATNRLASSPTISNANITSKNIKVDTVAPFAPTINNATNNSTFYGETFFSVGGIETNGRWEYHTDYKPNTESGWQTGGSNNRITLSKNGTYNIAARQFDNASPENASEVSTVYTDIKIDSGAILTKITSLNNNGNYSFGVKDKDTINIELEFRIPIYFTANSGSTSDAYIILNTTGGNNRAYLSSAVLTNTKKLTFEYKIPSGAVTPPNEYLDVTNLGFTNMLIKDAKGTDLITWIGLPEAAENRLNRQKEITILSGRPAASTNTLGTAVNQNIWFTGAQLGIRFDREIFRGTTNDKLIIRQIPNDYRIPAVLTEQKFNDLFSGREDMFDDQKTVLDNIFGTSGTASSTKAGLWKQLGDYLYEKGSNGATAVGTGNAPSLTPDTSTKYVLRFDVNTLNDPANNISGITGISGLTSITMADLTELFRAAEALTFGVNDPSITITNTTNLYILSIALSETRALPVRGATYEWIFPNGFVVDNLGRPNGTLATNTTPQTGSDTNISSNATERRLFYTKQGTALGTLLTETPIIRIDKGNDDVYFNNARNDKTDTSNNRQARQKLQANVKMDCRTPGSTITYRTANTSDSVGTLLMRNNPGTRPNWLPNLGTANTFDAWQAVRLRPQSGGGTWTTATGLNTYSAIGNWINGTNATYSSSLTIGSVNYSDGGQTFYFQARARVGSNTDVMTESEYGYEAAFRSVFVYNHANINGNATNNDINGTNNTDISNVLNRIWIRGSNTAQGDPTISDFPLSRNPALWKKIKLLTPITPPNNYAAGTALTDSNIEANATAASRCLWFWVTWKVNVNTFVDLQTGYLPENLGAYPVGSGGVHAPVSNIRKFYKAYIPSNEHYAVFPGRTTVIETRDLYGTQYDGDHGALDLTSLSSPSTPTDVQK